MKPLTLFLTLMLCLLGALPAVAQSNRSLNEHRVALVVGNATYKSSPLRNPINDARAMREKLRDMGFQVIYFEDLRTRQVGAALREFRTAIRPGSVALFFYAGHGLQVRGENFLPTVDAELASEDDVPQQSLAVEAVLNAMEDSKAAVNLVLLDACRNNPFARNFRSSATGLARVQAPSGTLIHYATRPGAVADDGSGRHGVYTEALLAHIGERGVPIETALKRVTTRVRDASKGRQEPWMEGSLTGDFYFVVSPGATVNVQPAQPTPANADEAAWQAAESLRTATAYQAYLGEFPRGLYAAAARVKLAALQGASPAAAPQAATVVRPGPGKVTMTPGPAIALAPSGATAPAPVPVAPAPVVALAPRDTQADATLVAALREMSLARITGGSFQMGADADEPGFDGQPDAAAQPRRGVSVGNYELAYYETQVYQWKKFVEATRYVTEAERSGGCHVPGRGGQLELRAGANWRDPGHPQTDYHPVVCVSHNDVVAYLAWLNSGPGGGTTCACPARPSGSSRPAAAPPRRGHGPSRPASSASCGKARATPSAAARGPTSRPAAAAATPTWPTRRWTSNSAGPAPSTAATATPRPPAAAGSGATTSASTTCWATPPSGWPTAGRPATKAHPATQARGSTALPWTARAASSVVAAGPARRPRCGPRRGCRRRPRTGPPTWASGWFGSRPEGRGQGPPYTVIAMPR